MEAVRLWSYSALRLVSEGSVVIYCGISPKSKFGQKSWKTIIVSKQGVRAHSLSSLYSSLEGATKLKFAPFCSP